jgi:hypothetical protein
MLSIPQINEGISNASASHPSARGWQRFSAVILLLASGFIGAFPGCKSKTQTCPDYDANPCTLDGCTNDAPIHEPLDGQPCFYGKLEGACQTGQCLIPCKLDGDCKSGQPCTKEVCGENGFCQIGADDNLAPPSDGNPCTSDLCLGGEPLYLTKASGLPCGQDGKLECDGGGVCGQCTMAADCGFDTECRKWKCADGLCQSLNDGEGTSIASLNAAGDCMKWICDGKGHIELVPDTIDVPWSNADCFSWECVGWTPVRKVKVGTNCTMEGGVVGFCDVAGACVHCVIDANCQVDEQCREGACIKCGSKDQNGNEVCGDSCGNCVGAGCGDDADCASGNCVFTNLQSPAKVCCSSACDGVCQRCEKTGDCIDVTPGQQDIDSCNDTGKVCAGTLCKIQIGYPCVKGLDCISGKCINGVCSN